MNAIDFVANLKVWFTDPPSHDATRYWGDMMVTIQRFNGPVLAQAATYFRENWKHRYPPTIGEVMEVCRTTPRDDSPLDDVHPWVRRRMEEERIVEMSPERRAANLKKLHDLLAELRATSNMAKAKRTEWLNTPIPSAPLEGVKISDDLRNLLKRETRNA